MKRTLAVLLSVLLLMVAACGDDEEPQADDETTEPGDEEPTTEPDDDGATDEPTTEPEPTDEPEPAEVRVGGLSYPALNYECMQIAMTQGFFEDEAITIDGPVSFGTNDETARAVFSGEMDVGIAGLATLIPAEQGVVTDVRAIASIGNPLFAFIAPPEIEDIEDMRGLTVALGAPTESSSALGTTVLDTVLGEGEYELLEATGGTSARVAAVQAGQADATVANSPGAERIEEEGEYHIVAYLEPLDPEVNYEVGAAWTMQEWIDSERDVAVRFVRAWDAGCKFLADPANQDAVEQHFTEIYEVSEGVAAALYEEFFSDPEGGIYHIHEAAIDIEMWENFQEILVGAEVMQGTLDLEEYYDGSLLEEARAG